MTWKSKTQLDNNKKQVFFSGYLMDHISLKTAVFKGRRWNLQSLIAYVNKKHSTKNLRASEDLRYVTETTFEFLWIKVGHVPGPCSTYFTNYLEQVTTFSSLDSFYRQDLILFKGGINKIYSHTRGSNFTLLLTLDRVKQTY